MNQNKAFLAVLFVVLICCYSAYAAPVIDNSNPGQFIKINSGDYQVYTVTANESITSWEWYVNGVAQSNDANNINVSIDGRGQQNVTVTGTNENGIATYSFYPYLHRETTATESVKVGGNGTDGMISAVQNADFVEFFNAVSAPGVMVLGGFYYLFIIILPFAMIWNRQRVLLVPSVVGLMIGSILLPILPDGFVKFAQLAILLGASAVIWALYKEK